MEICDSATLADSYLGDWIGTKIGADGKKTDVAAHVIALQKNQYQLNLRHSFSDPQDPWALIPCTVENGKLCQREVPDQGLKWDFELTGSSLIAIANDGTKWTLRRIKRVSPTLGLTPPSEAKILFDGSSLEQWQLLRDFNGHLFIPGVHEGNCCNYLKTRLWSDMEQKALMQAAHNTMMKMWLNGSLVYEEAAYIAPVRTNNKKNAEILLRQGWNEVLVKVVGYNMTSAAIRIVSPDGKPLMSIAEQNSSTAGHTRAFLAKADQHLTVWQYSGCYFLEGPDNSNRMMEVFFTAFTPEKKPAEAIWKSLKATLQDGDIWPMHHRIIDGCLEIYQSGDIMTQSCFGDYCLHLEFQIPSEPEGTGQARGNSGLYLGCRYEIQILDSYGLVPSNQDCGAAYYLKPPDINMSLPPLQWQTYDVFYTAPRFDGGGNKIKNAKADVYHNGVLIHDGVEFPNPTGGGMTFELPGKAPIHLQNHGSPVRYRNIWIIERRIEAFKKRA